ncbi:hypothetical protein Si004_00551 [Streptococcus infantarius subsp. infantarius]|nr:hypothetical protein [Streptococcus infantarius subsp. infantarius]MCO4671588.1 hypothetical protein [Streptococcus infantarius subsp. infantarius]MCO4674673.1 hypothetical protein [Streptococcus infantarius subsp. infantarius]MCO4676409.1 hypothetical protein [Streptococcus infantarius subsp. infantarius]MCO4679719.1 hypothetical protein [Streptococcus infantarius subsp. infantarius]
MKEIEQLKNNLNECLIVNFLEDYKNFLKNFTKTVIEDIEEEGANESDLISRLEIISNIEICEDSQYRSEITTGLESLVVKLTKSKISHVDYSRISQLVIDLKSDSKDDDESDISSLSDYIEASKLSLGDLINKFEQNKDDCLFSAESLTVLHKIIEHTSLINIQYINLYESQEKELVELVDRIDKAKIELSKAEGKLKNTKELEEKYEKINVEIISVLGIFASIIFAVFGGVSQLGALGGKLATTSVSKIFIFVGASSFALFSVVFMAFAATARLTGRELKSCGCSKNNDDKKCPHKIHERYPIYVISIIASFFILILGVLGNRGVYPVILNVLQLIHNNLPNREFIWKILSICFWMLV